jgi:hypothetical protein
MRVEPASEQQQKSDVADKPNDAQIAERMVAELIEIVRRTVQQSKVEAVLRS